MTQSLLFGKKKLRRLNIHKSFLVSTSIKTTNRFFCEFHCPCFYCEKCKITSHSYVFSGTVFSSFLTYKNFPSLHHLLTKTFYTTALRIGIATISGGATGFFMCHLGLLRANCTESRKSVKLFFCPKNKNIYFPTLLTFL